jgi:predicted site-specific integrase-resolvase
MTAKQWLENNGISEQTYYTWQRRFRLEAAPMILEE